MREDGIGRIGIIAITEKGVDSPTAEVVLAPERFRVDPAKLKAIETKLLAKSRPRHRSKNLGLPAII